MSKEFWKGCYTPDIIPESDLELYEKAGWGKRIGFGRKIAVLVVDMTRAFVEDRFFLGYEKTGRPAAVAIRKLLDKARPIGIPIIFTKGGGGWPGVGKIRRGRTENVSWEIANEIVEEITPLDEEIVLTKPKPSAFIGTPLLGILTHHNVDTIIVTGMVTSGCIRATIVDGFSYNYKVIVPLECVADRGQVPHKANLFDVDMKYSDVMALEDVLKHLDTVDKELYGN
jgi:nicotinamidase-related amidase